MNMKRMVVGAVIGTVFSVAVFTGLQFLIWGYYAPDWYALPVALFSIIFGWLGASLSQLW